MRDILKRKEELRAEFRAEEGKIPFEEDESDVEIQNIPVVDKENIINQLWMQKDMQKILK